MLSLVVTCSSGGTGTMVMAESVNPYSIKQGKEGARPVGTWKPLGEDTLPSGWSVTCRWENLYSREYSVQEQGWGVKELLRGDSGGRQRQHHPWAELGSGYVSSKSWQSDCVLRGFAFISHTSTSHTCISHTCTPLAL